MAVSKQVQERVEYIKKLCSNLMGREVVITFDNHTFSGTLTGITAKGVTGFSLAPEKREGADGKVKSPTLIQLTLDNKDNLVFVDEDTTWFAVMNGVMAEVAGDVTVAFLLREEK